MEKFDAVLEGAQVVTSEGLRRCTIGVRQGRTAALLQPGAWMELEKLDTRRKKK